MVHASRFLVPLTRSLLALTFLTSPAGATNFTWIGGTGNNWFTTNNWSPAEFGPPGDFDTALLSNGQLVLVDHNFGSGDRVDDLTITAGELRTNGYEVIVDDAVNGFTAVTLVTGAGSLLRLDPNASGPTFDSFDTDWLIVSNGGVVDMRSGSRLEVDSGLLTIDSGSSLKGRGAIDLERNVAAVTSVMVNDGVLRAGGDLVLPALPDTLQINVTSPLGRINLDGPSENGKVYIGYNTTLDINAPLSDAYSNLIAFGPGAELAMSSPWTADGFSRIEVDAFTEEATISGGAFTSSGDINVNSGTLIIESNFSGPNSTINVRPNQPEGGAKVQFNGSAVVGEVQLHGLVSHPAEISGDAIQIPAGALFVVTGYGRASGNYIQWRSNVGSAIQVGDNSVASGDGGASKFEIVGHAVIEGGLQLNGDATIAADEFDISGTVSVNDGVGIIMPDIIPQVATARFLSGSVTDVNVITGDTKLQVEGDGVFGGTFNLNGSGGIARLAGHTMDFPSGAVVNVNAPVGAIMPLDHATFRPGSEYNLNATVGDVKLMVEGTAQYQGTFNLHGSGGTATIAGDIIEFESGAAVNVDGVGIIMPDLRARFLPGSVLDGRGATVRLERDVASTGNVLLDATSHLHARPNSVVAITQPIANLDGAVTVDAGATLTFNVDSFGVGNTILGTLTLAGETTLSSTSNDPVVMHDINLVGIDPLMLHPRSGGPLDAVLTGTINVDSPTATIDGKKRLDAATLNVAPGSELIVKDATEMKDMIVDTPGNWRTDGPLTLSGSNNVKIELLVVVSPWTISGDTTLTATTVDFLDALPLTVDPTKRLTLNADTITSGNLWYINAGGRAEVNTLGPWTAGNDITLDGGTLFSQQEFTFEGALQGSGVVQFSGVTPPKVRNAGKLIPGFSPGLIQIEGGYEQTALGELRIELGGLTPETEYDVLSVIGAATLGGYLQVDLINGFTPALGDTFEILTATGGVTGMFAHELLPDLGLLALHVFYDTSAVTLAVVPALAGDYNADGIVDAADYAAYRNLLGQTGIGLVADGNHDGQVTPLDYDIWRSHFGQSAGSGSFTDIQIPEPASCSSAMIGLVVLCWQSARTARCRSRS